jgi:hypothetical protein
MNRRVLLVYRRDRASGESCWREFTAFASSSAFPAGGEGLTMDWINRLLRGRGEDETSSSRFIRPEYPGDRGRTLLLESIFLRRHWSDDEIDVFELIREDWMDLKVGQTAKTQIANDN